jgi:hypothetical protein
MKRKQAAGLSYLHKNSRGAISSKTPRPIQDFSLKSEGRERKGRRQKGGLTFLSEENILKPPSGGKSIEIVPAR